MAKMNVKDTEITVVQINNEDYLCLTDMIKAKDGDFFITDWLRNRNTLEYIGIWEKVYNPNFNYGEFATIKSQSGLNSFKISVKEFVARTNAISLQAKAGRYGGTYAHKDIAFEFAMWISPEFKIYIVKEFQRLKEEEQKLLGWSAKRELAKINYRIHTDAIKQNLIPQELTPAQKSFVYADDDAVEEKLLMKMFLARNKVYLYLNYGADGLKASDEEMSKLGLKTFMTVKSIDDCKEAVKLISSMMKENGLIRYPSEIKVAEDSCDKGFTYVLSK